MTGRTLTHRPLGQHMYDVVADGHTVIANIQLNTGVAHPSTAITTIMSAFADHQGDTYANPHQSSDQWRRLGWTGRAEHDAMFAVLTDITDSWSGHPHDHDRIAHVTAAKLAAGIPERRPYSLDQLIDLECIIARTPAVVAQDLAAEQVTAA